MKITFSFLLLTLLLCPNAWAAARKVAVVKLLKGEVDVLTLGKTSRLKVEDWVEEGAVVKTAEKSFVKLVFIDKSQMNIGPGSEMKIEKFGEQDSGVIDLVKGKIRSQVTKDYLQMDKNKSKLFIKTPNAVLGVRGTDFMISTNGKASSVILFEGAVSFNKLEERGETNSNRLEAIVDRGVAVKPGEFSVVDKVHPLPTVPAVLNIQQRQLLEKNPTFESRSPGNTTTEVKTDRSIVPGGISGDAVVNNLSEIKNQVPEVKEESRRSEAALAGKESAEKASLAGTGIRTPVEINKGYEVGRFRKPANGSSLDPISGVIIKPKDGSVFDPNTRSYISPDQKFTATGEIDLGKDKMITEDGKIFETRTDIRTGEKTVVESTPESPVIKDNIARSPSDISAGTAPENVRVPVPVAELPIRQIDDPQRDLRNINQIENQGTSKVIFTPTTGP